jgi:kynurenine formamidase
MNEAAIRQGRSAVSANIESLFASLPGLDIVQLGHELFVGAPRFESHPPFMYSLSQEHGTGGGLPGQFCGVTGASDAFAMGVHTGTHMDSLSHVAFHECLCDGTNVFAQGMQSPAGGVRMNSGDAMRPIVAPGVLLDFPALIREATLPRDFAITPAEVDRCCKVQGVSIGKGDVVLVRTGWDTLWPGTREYTLMPMPGPNGDTARLLAQIGVVATGSDTLAYEQAPGDHPLEVHAELLSKAGIFIFESLNLKGLSERRAYRFIFAVAPLRIAGQTGSPVNPLALVPARPQGK